MYVIYNVETTVAKMDWLWINFKITEIEFVNTTLKQVWVWFVCL